MVQLHKRPQEHHQKLDTTDDKTVQSTQERNLLKNLGSWLGSLALAWDKPIHHSNIVFKDLLIQGYDSNQLIVAIPFVCKVMEQCAKSNVFKPPNPWLMAFEIEVLFKGLDVELKDVPPTTIFHNRPSAELLQQQQHQQQQSSGQLQHLSQQQQQQAAVQMQLQQQHMALQPMVAWLLSRH
ncbi:related to CDC39 - transcriptional regulator protein [Ustilago sp. UG-2017b]|nr:related to CDC39 - transcriptional regulator protein [Ustilago sp. UG-2017b]